MASFDEHISQTQKNLFFLKSTNKQNSKFWDWQVTVCFYSAVHAVNAHLARIADLHYRAHEEVKNALNPFGLSPAKIDEDIYLSYVKLEGLARRARYLCHDNRENKSVKQHLTHDKHFARAVRHLDKIIAILNQSIRYRCRLLHLLLQNLHHQKQ